MKFVMPFIHLDSSALAEIPGISVGNKIAGDRVEMVWETVPPDSRLACFVLNIGFIKRSKRKNVRLNIEPRLRLARDRVGTPTDCAAGVQIMFWSPEVFCSLDVSDFSVF